MPIQQAVADAMDAILTTPWLERNGRVVPEADDVNFRDGAVKVSATYLYADLGDSTGLAHNVNPKVAARVIRGYLNASARIINKYKGEIRSYDGDRIMGIFMGGHPNNCAVRAALGINWAFRDVLLRKAENKWPRLPELWDMTHGVGVDTGTAMIVRGGVIGRNDLVSIGRAPNVAAKLSDIREGGSIFITQAVYQVLTDDQKFSANGRAFWKASPNQTIGGVTVKVLASDWWKKP